MHPALRSPRAQRVGTAAAALLLVLLSTGSQPEVTPPETRAQTSPHGLALPAEGGLAAGLGDPAGTAAPTGDESPPASDEGAPAADEPARPDLPDEVELHEPDLVVRSEQPLSAADAEDVPGTGHVAPVGELTATTADPAGEQRSLQLLAADATTLRPFTPEVTAQSRAVWERLADGDVLLRHDLAHELQIELGEHIELHGDAGSVEVRVGALAANGAPPLAEAIVPRDVAEALGQRSSNALLVAVDDEHAPEQLAEPLGALGEVEVRRPPEPEQTGSRPTGGPVELESFTYTSRGDGTIEIHGDWVQRNIVGVDLPNMGTARCHRAMVPQLIAALQQVIDEGLYDHLEPGQYGGCFSPRHKMFNPNRGLSMHAWGLAIDFNVFDNAYGAEPQMDPRIVEIFERWGFGWGGHWSTPDGMHFEVKRFVQVD
jgi:hypothetical protein